MGLASTTVKERKTGIETYFMLGLESQLWVKRVTIAKATTKILPLAVAPLTNGFVLFQNNVGRTKYRAEKSMFKFEPKVLRKQKRVQKKTRI